MNIELLILTTFNRAIVGFSIDEAGDYMFDLQLFGEKP